MTQESHDRPRRVRRPPLKPESCAAMWQDAREPAWGSAAPARFWVALEQPGPWGRLAFVQSKLDPQLGKALEAGCSTAGGRALLIRAVGQHRIDRSHEPTNRTVFVAGGMPAGKPWLLTGVITDPSHILDLPFAALADADPEPAMRALPSLELTTTPALLLCTNAKRDACCAVVGRPVALESASSRPCEIWECTHTGGHRFAPTGVLLPSGATLGRLTTPIAIAAVDAAHHGLLAGEANTPRHLRGMAHLSPIEQAADAWVRYRIREADVTALTTYTTQAAEDGRAGQVEVGHRDGRSWSLVVHRHTDEETLRRNSCVTGPVPTVSWLVEHASAEPSSL